MINELCNKAHKNAVNKGFWAEEKSFPEQIDYIMKELNEALEEYKNKHKPNEIYFNCIERRKGCSQICHTCDKAKPEGIPIELADALIIIFDTAAYYRINLEHAIKMKMEYNESRPYKHGKIDIDSELPPF